MRRHHRARRLGRTIGVLAVPAVGLLGMAALPGQAGAALRVGPHQTFGGTINGSDGVASPARIQMACFGPIVPGAMGHPLPHQTIGIFQPEVIVGPWGNTGANATEIRAFFGPPPPVPGPSPNQVAFKSYVTKKLPTSLLLPCAGTGTVSFVPLPMDPPNSTSYELPVIFEGQP
ncbi:MAG TPA: hypothetical protein VKG43_04265 [Acidimicrobiales bacterium]|nr:hypothetical protein [Acidimicrobiales bacterium]